jgi:hypothetical protein
MIYEENRTRWNVGDLVLHDCDAKKAFMLMKVVRVYGEMVETVYLDRSVSKSKWTNNYRSLHDPRRFGIDGGSV